MKLADLLDESKLCEHVNARVVNMQHHRYAPLAIYNYGQKAQFDGIWDDVTCKTRGLIVNQATGEVVARPFEKFFNYATSFRPETQPENLPPFLPEVTEKLDGSLGVLYCVNGLRRSGMSAGNEGGVRCGGSGSQGTCGRR